ncbi:MAG: hypothetical protein KF916_05480 [Microbacteriaceae bacterium]|nr:hypothetical protein [Microbacteriaceae bacterium]
MFNLVVSVLLLFIAGYVFIKANRQKGLIEKAKNEGKDLDPNFSSTTYKIAAGVLVAGSLVVTGASMIYTQDPGEAKVIRSWTGEVTGQSTLEGLKFKAPWEDLVNYDIRNQQVIFAKEAL